MTSRVCLATLVLGALIYVLAPSPVSIAVEGSRFPFEPATVRLKLTIEPDSRNRWVWFGLDDGQTDRPSYVSGHSLNGADEPRTRWREFRDVAAGSYAAFIQVQRVDGTEATARDTVTVQARY